MAARPGRSTDPRSPASRVRGGSRTSGGGSPPGHRRHAGPRRRPSSAPAGPSTASRRPRWSDRSPRPAAPPRPCRARRSFPSHRLAASGVRDCAPQCRPLIVEPALEFRRPRDVEPGREVTPPPGQRLFPSLRGEQRPQSDRVTPDRRRIELDVTLSPGHDRALPERLPQPVERVAERMSGRIVVRLRPQERHQAVPGLGPGGLGQREVEQEREPLGLGDGRDRRVAIARLDRQSAGTRSSIMKGPAETARIGERTARRQDGDSGKVSSLFGLHIGPP